MVTLLPRLRESDAEDMLDDFLSNGTNAWKGFDPNNLPDPVRFAATGGLRVSPRQLQDIREGIVEVAVNCGLGKRGKKKKFARFDSDVSVWLAKEPILASGEALRDDVWTFIGVAMVPDVVRWRFGAARERYFGGVRNTFQRLWMRARSLDRGAGTSKRWKLLYELTEDALVQITERPSIGANPILSREIGEAWVRSAKRHGKGRMEPIMRHATLHIRIQNEIQSISSLPSAELRKMLDAFFDIAKKSVATQ